MAIDFTIRIVNEEGAGVAGAKVFVSYQFTHQEDYTDDDGWVQFERLSTIHGGVRADIHVNGENVSKQVWIDDGDTFSFTI